MRIARSWKYRISALAACLAFARSMPGQAAPTSLEKAAAEVPGFDVTSVKPNTLNDGRWRLFDSREGWSGMGVSLFMLVETAYDIFEPDRIEGLPKWANTDKFDLEGKVAESDIAAFRSLNYAQHRLMLQHLLTERFGLVVHFEDRTRPIYALIVGKTGPKFQETKPEELPAGGGKDMAFISRSRSGQFTAKSYTMAMLTHLLMSVTGRYVQDATGMTGRYDIALDWTPEDAAPPRTDPATPLPAPTPIGPSIFTAVREQLGLKLEPRNGPVPVLVIDHAAKPLPN